MILVQQSDWHPFKRTKFWTNIQLWKSLRESPIGRQEHVQYPDFEVEVGGSHFVSDTLQKNLTQFKAVAIQISNRLFSIIKRRRGKNPTLKKDLFCKKGSFNQLAHTTKFEKV